MVRVDLTGKKGERIGKKQERIGKYRKDEKRTEVNLHIGEASMALKCKAQQNGASGPSEKNRKETGKNQERNRKV